ncbi:MAG: amidohydrolase family protein [Chloroflexota bacterium]|nr:amidohydrolase family protein [Chloroflexota bacterium]
MIEGHLAETGRAVRIEVVGSHISSISATARTTDVWLAPGFIDIQVNGYLGHDLNSPDVTADIVARFVKALWAAGVTTVCPTVTTQSELHICRALNAIREACDLDPQVAHSVACIHVEGPYISPQDGARGAHPLEHVRAPSLDEYQRWQEAAGGRIGIITLAPEYPGSVEYIRTIVADGVVAALGHTAASEDEILAAVNAGATLSTHLGNGSHAMIDRHRNYIWDQMAEDRLTASLIFDGHHLPPALMKVMLRAKTLERVILTSDAVAVAGLGPGIYETSVGRKVERLPNGRLNLYGTPYLAGSASALPDGIANAVRYAGATLTEAVRMATANPACMLSLNGPKGRGALREGALADITAFRMDPGSDDLSIETTIVAGKVVFQRGQ